MRGLSAVAVVAAGATGVGPVSSRRGGSSRVTLCAPARSSPQEDRALPQQTAASVRRLRVSGSRTRRQVTARWYRDTSFWLGMSVSVSYSVSYARWDS